MHAQLVDGQIVTVGDLPTTWKWPDGSTTSLFQYSDPEVLASAGFVAVTEERPPLGDGQTYGDPVYEVHEGAVTATYPVHDPEPGGPPPSEAVLAAVSEARQAATRAAGQVTGLSPNGDTRKSVEALISSNEALATAVETLVASALA